MVQVRYKHTKSGSKKYIVIPHILRIPKVIFLRFGSQIYTVTYVKRLIRYLKNSLRYR